MKRLGAAVWTIPLLVVMQVPIGCGGGSAKKKPPELNVAGKVRLAQAYVKGGRLGEALSTLEEAIQKEQENAGLRNFFGQVSFLAARYDQAEAALRRALELDPFLTDAHNNLGVLYDKLGRKDEAEEEFSVALEDPAYPTPDKVYLNLGLLYLSQGRADDAIAQFRRAVEINPKYYQAHFELASILDRNGRLEEAAREYEVAEPAYKGSGEYHYRIGFTYVRLGEQQKAREHLNRVLDVSPGSNNAVRADELLKMME